MYKIILIISLILIIALNPNSFAQEHQETVKRIGKQMSIAVLPFENRAGDQKLVEEILDELIIKLSNQDRFNVINKAQLNKIIEERYLELLWKIDIPIAAEIGREYDIDAIILATISSRESGSINIDAIVTDAASGLIIVAHGTLAENADSLSINNAVERLAAKIVQSIPVLEGSVIQVNDDYTVLLDSGLKSGLRRGMRCTIYNKSLVRQHPISGKILDPKILLLGEVLIVESLDEIATAQLLNFSKRASIAVGDMFLTK